VICAFVLVGWLVSFKHRESAFANGILVLAFIDLVYFAAEQLHQQLYISIAVVAVLLILDVFIHYEATFYDQNIGFEIFCAIVIVVHAPINFLSVTHRWDMVQLGKGTKKKKKKRKRKRKGANTTVNATDSDSDGSSNDSDGENAIGNNNNNNKYNNLDMESDDDEKLIGA